MLQLFKPNTTEKRSLELLRKGLNLCHTLKDVAKVKEVLQLHHTDFDIQEIINFNLEIRYRKKLLKIVDKNYNLPRYALPELALMFKRANYMECDALLIHIDKNKGQYRKRNELGYDIYKTMWCNRKHAIKMQLLKESLQAKTTIFAKFKLFLSRIFKDHAVSYELQRYGHE